MKTLKIKSIFSTILCVIWISGLSAQSLTVTGTVTDENDHRRCWTGSVITLSNMFLHLSVKGSTECMNLLPVDVSFCRMECEVKCQQNAASGPPPAEQNAGCLPALKLRLRLFARNLPFQTLLDFVKPVQTQ